MESNSSSELSNSDDIEMLNPIETDNNEIDETSDNRNQLKSKSKSKKPKKINISPEFLDYFEAFRIRKEFLSNDNQDVQNLDFNIDLYSTLTDNYTKTFPSKFIETQKLLSDPDNYENINKITAENLYELISELITNQNNVFLYGFGSKLKLVYNFIEYFQTNVNGQINEDDNYFETNQYHILIFNCYNPEMTIKIVLNEILSYIMHLMEIVLNHPKGEIEKAMKKNRSREDQVQAIKNLIHEMEKKNFYHKFLLILNNIDGPNFIDKSVQYILSNLINFCGLNTLVTCDNVNLVHLWRQNVKDYFTFYFLKFDTFEQYEVEISDLNGMSGEKGIRSGRGLEEIFQSFNKPQRELLKEIARIQLKEEWEKMTAQGIVEYLIDNGSGICNQINRFEDLIYEAKDHGVVIKKTINKNGIKEIYKLALDKEIIERIAKGEFDFNS